MTGVQLLLLAQEAAADPPALAMQLAPWGVLSAAIGLFSLMWRSVVTAHGKRADDWRAAFEIERVRADELNRQLVTVLSVVRDAAGAS